MSSTISTFLCLSVQSSRDFDSLNFMATLVSCKDIFLPSLFGGFDCSLVEMDKNVSQIGPNPISIPLGNLFIFRKIQDL